MQVSQDLFSDSTSCVGISNPDPSNNWATTLDEAWNEHGFAKKKRTWHEVIWHVLPGAPTLNIKKHIQRYLNGQDPESFEDRIIFMSMFNDNERTQKGNAETCLQNTKEVAAFATRFKPGHQCFLEAASENTWWNGKIQRTSRKMRYYRIAFGCRIQVSFTLHMQYFQQQWWGKEDHFQSTYDNKKIFIKTHIGKQFTLYLQSNLPVVGYPKFGTHTEKVGRRRANPCRTRAVDIHHAATAGNATSSRRLVATIHWESRDADSQSIRTGSICQNVGNWTLLLHWWNCCGWKQLYSFMHRILSAK